MGCSVSKREVKKPIKYDFLPPEGQEPQRGREKKVYDGAQK
jgi:hypothetical protein